MGRAKQLKATRKEARRQVSSFIESEGAQLARRIMKDRPRFMPKFLWRLIARINIKVPIDL